MILTCHPTEQNKAGYDNVKMHGGKKAQSVGRRGTLESKGSKVSQGTSDINGWDTGQRSKVRNTGSIGI